MVSYSFKSSYSKIRIKRLNTFYAHTTESNFAQVIFPFWSVPPLSVSVMHSYLVHIKIVSCEKAIKFESIKNLEIAVIILSGS
jgi:hypothetical protein